jgi:hypothetical protein
MTTEMLKAKYPCRSIPNQKIVMPPKAGIQLLAGRYQSQVGFPLARE